MDTDDTERNETTLGSLERVKDILYIRLGVSLNGGGVKHNYQSQSPFLEYQIIRVWNVMLAGLFSKIIIIIIITVSVHIVVLISELISCSLWHLSASK